MKKALLPLALLITSQAFAQNLTSVPFYFAVPKTAYAPLTDKTSTPIKIKEVATDLAGLRAYKFTDTNILTGGVAGQSSNSVVEAKRKTRRAAVNELVKKGILKSGDIVLSFRPSWENTVPYSHLQMGISHAGMIFVENGVARNLDMPLDSEYNGNNLTSSMDSNHYIETDHFQIVRPRSFDASKQANLLAWVGQLRKNYSQIRNGALLKFNPDYSAAKIDKYGAGGDAFVTTMGKIIVGENKSSTDLKMFCSEFVWAMQAIMSCTPDQILGESAADATCVKPIFEAMTMVAQNKNPGLTEGPLAVIKSLNAGATVEDELTQKLFTQGEMLNLSSGHRALATNPAVQQLVGALAMVYPAKLRNDMATAGAISAQINPAGGRNYSPTSFLINAMLDASDPQRKFDYVATIIFAPKL